MHLPTLAMSQFQQMMNGQSSPLGTLSLFPQEVRDLVYQEVVEHPAECCLHEVCSSAVDLTIKLCNKQINREVAAYSAKQPTAYACKHWSFFIRLPSFKELSKTQVHHNVIEHIIQRDVGLGNRRHDIAYAKRLRFIGFQGSDVPLGVVIHLQLPGGSTVAVHGASSERTRVVTKHMQHLLRDFDHRAPPNTIDSAGMLRLSCLLETRLTYVM